MDDGRPESYISSGLITCNMSTVFKSREWGRVRGWETSEVTDKKVRDIGTHA